MTELLYFRRLCELINSETTENGRLELCTAVNRNPMRNRKRLQQKAERNGEPSAKIWHVLDTEEPQDYPAFEQAVIDARKCGMEVCCSNMTFELWILLHKERAASSLASKQSYLRELNPAFGLRCHAMHAFKEKDNLRRLFNRLTLDDVRRAIANAESIAGERQRNDEPRLTADYRWYAVNPYTDVQKLVRSLLEEAGIPYLEIKER